MLEEVSDRHHRRNREKRVSDAVPPLALLEFTPRRCVGLGFLGFPRLLGLNGLTPLDLSLLTTKLTRPSFSHRPGR